jgi:tRNA(Ile)-lysidine synthetase-like protein
VRLNWTSAPSGHWAQIEAEVAKIMSARLDRDSAAPIAVALSGGGDSVAVLLAARRWALSAGRRLVCLTVDHGLSPLSGAWTATCADRARSLGLEHRTLVWTGAKPAAGLAAAARAARHRLLADAAREAGAAVILIGHTADDRLEARAMRAEGCSVSEPRAWSPSPAWPGGRGVFILRPLIDIRRAAIRRGLAERGETWLDDPANVDAISLRARVRARIGDGGETWRARETGDAAALFGAAAIGWAGDIQIDLDTARVFYDVAPALPERRRGLRRRRRLTSAKRGARPTVAAHRRRHEQRRDAVGRAGRERWRGLAPDARRWRSSGVAVDRRRD